MKWLGGIIFLIGIYGGIGWHPLFFIVSAVGMLTFLQGVENTIIENTTEYVRRAMVEKKTYYELRNDELGTRGNSDKSERSPDE